MQFRRFLSRSLPPSFSCPWLAGYSHSAGFCTLILCLRLEARVMTTLFQLKQVSKVSGSGQVAVFALHPTDLVLHAGEFAAVIGPSGSGVTTL